MGGGVIKDSAYVSIFDSLTWNLELYFKQCKNIENNNINR